MKLNTILPFLTLLICLACNTAQQAQTSPAPPTPPAKTKPAFVTWDKKLIELGKVKRGEKREMFFEFTNTSGQDIQIDIVDACSCTTVDFPRGIITPGGKGRLDVVFDSTEKEAAETIGITVVFKNTDENGFQKIESVEYRFEL
jgi:peptidoglycan-associated lipoprotein